MTPLRVFRWRWLRLGVLVVATVIGVAVLGLTLWGLPAPPAITIEQTPRVSWKWVWKSVGFVQRLQKSRRFAAWMPGEDGILVHVGFPGAVHLVPHAGADPTRLNGLPERAREIVQSRYVERPYFVFSLDEGGSERYVQHRFDLQYGTYEALNNVAARSYAGGFDAEGRRLIYTSTRRNQRDSDLYVVDVMQPASDTRVLEGDGQFFGILAPDGRTALVSQVVSHTSTLVTLLDIETRAQRPLFGGAAVDLIDAVWTRDGATVYAATALDGEFAGVHALDPVTGTATLLTPDLPWDVLDVELLMDGRTLALAVNEDGQAVLHLLDTVTRQVTRAREHPPGDVGRIVAHPRAPLIALDIVSPDAVSGLWVYDASTGRFTPWSVPDVEPTGLPEPLRVSYPTFDSAPAGTQRTIPAFVFPAASGYEGRRPVMIDIHGGPALQARSVAAPHFELVRNAGVTVITPNVRGSRGYGRTFSALDDGPRREDAVRDIGALLDWIATQPTLDPERVAITGGSYGGYMTLASLVHYSDRVRCGMELFGISDFVTFLEASEDGHFPDAQRAEYGDERDPATRAFLASISPARNAERIRVPLLIFQGANDVRVKPSESRQMVARIREAGGTVAYAEAADEGHGLEQPLNQLYIGALATEYMAGCLTR
jgi:dipeptidyl aminopeptidase/acylaminoacyl peptidase